MVVLSKQPTDQTHLKSEKSLHSAASWLFNCSSDTTLAELKADVPSTNHKAVKMKQN